jgi:hypothetical protein
VKKWESKFIPSSLIGDQGEGEREGGEKTITLTLSPSNLLRIICCVAIVSKAGILGPFSASMHA